MLSRKAIAKCGVGASMLLASGLGSGLAFARPTFHSVFGDHAVLQRDRPVKLWGQASPMEAVTVQLGDQSREVVADKDGNWVVHLPAIAAGGPYSLTVKDKAGEGSSITDVLIGDVFLCSGQSNMEMQVKASMNANNEIRRTDAKTIRMFTVNRASAPQPLAQFSAQSAWKLATPDNVGDFSAVCYYFARELQPHINVPIGLISASWGGSAIDSWIGAQQLTAAGRGAEISLLKQYAQNEPAAQAEFGKFWERYWTREFPSAGQLWSNKSEAGWTPLPMPMRDWKTWGRPELKQLNGMVWFRKSFTLTAEQAKQGATLHLGGIDEIDMTWVNGKPLGQTFGWGDARKYALPQSVLRAGQNEIVTNVYSGWDAGGMYGPPEAIKLELADKASVALGDGWTYRTAPDDASAPPRAPWLSIGGVTTIGNAMIKPLGAYGLRGGLWYQGESDAGNPGAYRGLLGSLIGDWRGQFENPKLPIMVVQLPNFGQPVTAPTNSNWSELREAQRLSVRDDPNAGLAVTIDAGEETDIHPPNKQIVGQRLARLARSLVYQQPVTANGPVLKSVERGNGQLRVTFSGIDGQLITRSATTPIAFELCGVAANSCAFVPAQIDGNSVILTSADSTVATRLRYCWGDAPICNLYDSAGLPAGPFEALVP
jgi:sialate O-acetylesterase